jgi:hypothetical protein
MKNIFVIAILFSILIFKTSIVFSQCACTTPPFNNIVMDWEIKYDGWTTNKNDIAYDVEPIDTDGNPLTDEGYVAVGSVYVPGELNNAIV